VFRPRELDEGAGGVEELTAAQMKAPAAEAQDIAAYPPRKVFESRSASQDRPHPRQKLLFAEGFADVVVCTDLETDHSVHLLAAGGDHDDRQRASRPKSTAQIEPIHT
jgi:hypothetical protein